MKNIILTFTTTCLCFTTIALYAFCSGKVQYQGSDYVQAVYASHR